MFSLMGGSTRGENTSRFAVVSVFRLVLRFAGSYSYRSRHLLQPSWFSCPDQDSMWPVVLKSRTYIKSYFYHVVACKNRNSATISIKKKDIARLQCRQSNNCIRKGNEIEYFLKKAALPRSDVFAVWPYTAAFSNIKLGSFDYKRDEW